MDGSLASQFGEESGPGLTLGVAEAVSDPVGNEHFGARLTKLEI